MTVHTETEDLTVLIPFEDTDDGKDHLTHVIRPYENDHIYQEGMEGADIVAIGRMNGHYIIALCGYKFIPKRNPEKYPACQTCMDLAAEIIKEHG